MSNEPNSAAERSARGSGPAARWAEEPWGAVFVLYRPDLPAVERSLAVVRELGGSPLLVDNTPESAADPAWAAARGAELIFNGNRDGIAGALEEGFRWAESRGLPWLLTMDQDSVVRKEWLGPLLLWRGRLPGDAAILSADHVVDVEAFGLDCPEEMSLRRLRDTMTSGNLVRVEAWRNSPGFDRSLFIDQVDHDFCLKLGKAGYTVWRLVGAKMRHPLGAMTFHRVFGFRVHACHHSPSRWHTISRNLPRVALRHCLRYPKFACREVVHYAEMFLAMLVFEEDRPAKLRAAARGFRDLLLGRSGAPR